MKKNTPMLSIIVPVYNCEKTIEKCVDSILKQNYLDFELILIMMVPQTIHWKSVCIMFKSTIE